MGFYLVEPKSRKAVVVLRDQMKERRKMSFRDRMAFNILFSVEEVEEPFSLKFFLKNQVAEGIDKHHFVKTLKMPFVEAGLREDEYICEWRE